MAFVRIGLQSPPAWKILSPILSEVSHRLGVSGLHYEVCMFRKMLLLPLRTNRDDNPEDRERTEQNPRNSAGGQPWQRLHFAFKTFCGEHDGGKDQHCPRPRPNRTEH